MMFKDLPVNTVQMRVYFMPSLVTQRPCIQLTQLPTWWPCWLLIGSTRLATWRSYVQITLTFTLYGNVAH